MHVLSVQRCVATLVVLISYGLLLWLVYTVWLSSAAHQQRTVTTLPVDYETWRSWTSERARQAATAEAATDTTDRHGRHRRPAGVGDSGDYVDGFGDNVDGFAGDVNNLEHVLTSPVDGADLGITPAGSEYGDYDHAPAGDENHLGSFQQDEDDGPEAADSEEATERPANRRVLVLTSVPQTGSEVISLLLSRLARQNNFRLVQLPAARPGPLSEPEQDRLLESIGSLSTTLEDGVCVWHSSYVMDFSRQNTAPPLQFSMIRDPIDMVMSRFTHERVIGGYSPPPLRDGADWPLTLEECLRTGHSECTFLNGHEYPQLAVPFFCGHYRECTRHNSRWALERAKRTVERQFVSVGVLEDMNTTLAVAETLVPRFFSGVWDTFFIDLADRIGDSMLARPRTELSEEARQRLRANLTTEYEFYEFVKQRVQQQYSAFVLGS